MEQRDLIDSLYQARHPRMLTHIKTHEFSVMGTNALFAQSLVKT